MSATVTACIAGVIAVGAYALRCRSRAIEWEERARDAWQDRDQSQDYYLARIDELEGATTQPEADGAAAPDTVNQ